MKISLLPLISIVLITEACAQEPKASHAVGVKTDNGLVSTSHAAAVETNVATPAIAQGQLENASSIDRADSASAVQSTDEHSWKTIDANVVASLKRELVGIGQVDGKPITDVQLRSKCQTAFVTGEATTIVDWTNIGNFAGRSQDGVATIPIDDGKAHHSFTMPDGATFRRVDGSLGLLADECEHGR